MNHKLFSRTAICASVAGAALMASSTVFGAALQSIADSYHNLGANNTIGRTPNDPNGTANHSNDTGEICVFCHTPHGGDSSAAVPIWNRKLNAASSYTRYSSLGTSTFDATEAPVGSVTIACLSCHDGTQAIDSVINAPGSGGYNPDGARIGTGFVGDDQTNGALRLGIVQNLGQDLTNDHPVSMQYAGGGVSVSALDGPTNDPDFVAGQNEAHPRAFTLDNELAPSTSSLSRLWWIERGTLSLNPLGRDRTDIILYTRLEGETGITGEQPFVECGSCHDPHNVDNPTFLRVSNGVADTTQFPNAVDPNYGSALCLTCHTK